MKITNKYAKLLTAKINEKDGKQTVDENVVKEITTFVGENAVEETTIEEATIEEATNTFTIPPTCDKLDSIPKNVHYITNAPTNAAFVVVIDKEPHIENSDCLRRQILEGLYVYIDDGNVDYAIDNLRGHWPYVYKPEEDGSYHLEECKSINNKEESIAEGFCKRLKPLKYMNGNLVYEYKGEQFRIQLTKDTHKHFAYYCCNYTKQVKITEKVRGKNKYTETYKKCDISFWLRCSTGGNSEGYNSNEALITYKDLNDKLKEVIEDLIGQDASECSTDEIRFLQGEYRGTPKHDYKDHDGNPCGAM